MSTQTTHDFQVGGMSCQHCVKAVTAAIVAQDEHAEVRVDLPKGHVRVTSALSGPAVADLIREEGYDVQASAVGS